MLPHTAAKADARFAASDRFDEAWVAEKIGRLLDNCHPKQRDFVADPGLFVNALVGRGGGKTTGAMFRLLSRMFATPRARCVYIALTRPSAEQLLWIPLKNVLEKLGFGANDVTYNETKLRCTLTRNGSVLELVGCDTKSEVEKLRGRPFHEVVIDESASFNPDLLDNLVNRIIGPRLGDYRGVLVMIGTPGHILKGEFYDATRDGSPEHRRYVDRELPEYADWKGWSSHAWTLLDGAEHGVAALRNLWERALYNKAKKGWGDDHPIWSREYLGRWAADDTENVYKYRSHDADGNPWNQWDPERVGPMRIAKLPPRPDWEFAASMDMGHSDPFAVNVFAFSPSDASRTIYHVYGFEQTKMYAKTIAELLIGKELNADRPGGLFGALGQWPIGVNADLAGLGEAVIDELTAVYGIRVAAVEKGYKYKFPAIELVNGDLLEGRIKILKGSALETQLLTLQWVADEYGKLSENRAQANHSSDTLVGARRMIANMFETGGLSVDAAPRSASTAPDEPNMPAAPDVFESLLDDNAYDDGLSGF